MITIPALKTRGSPNILVSTPSRQVFKILGKIADDLSVGPISVSGGYLSSTLRKPYPDCSGEPRGQPAASWSCPRGQPTTRAEHRSGPIAPHLPASGCRRQARRTGSRRTLPAGDSVISAYSCSSRPEPRSRTQGGADGSAICSASARCRSGCRNTSHCSESSISSRIAVSASRPAWARPPDRMRAWLSRPGGGASRGDAAPRQALRPPDDLERPACAGLFVLTICGVFPGLGYALALSMRFPECRACGARRAMIPMTSPRARALLRSGAAAPAATGSRPEQRQPTRSGSGGRQLLSFSAVVIGVFLGLLFAIGVMTRVFSGH